MQQILRLIQACMPLFFGGQLLLAKLLIPGVVEPVIKEPDRKQNK